LGAMRALEPNSTRCGNCGAPRPPGASLCPTCQMPFAASDAAKPAAPPAAGSTLWLAVVGGLGVVVVTSLVGVGVFLASGAESSSSADPVAVAASPSAAFACAKGDRAACRAACDAGHAESCVELEARRDVERGSPATATADGSAAAPSEEPSASTSAAPDTSAASEPLPRAVIQRIIQQQRNQYRACYERALARQPALKGRVKVRFVIRPDGTVRQASDAGSDLPDREVIDCVLRAVRTLTFPTWTGDDITVVYPLAFEPG